MARSIQQLPEWLMSGKAKLRSKKVARPRVGDGWVITHSRFSITAYVAGEMTARDSFHFIFWRGGTCRAGNFRVVAANLIWLLPARPYAEKYGNKCCC